MSAKLIFNEEYISMLAPLREGLQGWYCKVAPMGKPDAELLLDIERSFGVALLQDVCVPMKLWQGACLLMALAVAKNVRTLELHL